MSNDSSVAGFLAPTSSPLEDAALENFLQGLIVGLTNLDPSLVRPRWQPQMPNMPDNATNWVSIGIVDDPADTFAYEAHDPTGEGQDYVQRHEELALLCSFYGPGARGLAALVRDGLSVEQNRAYLTPQSMALIGCSSTTSVPEQVNNIWYNRVDMTINIRRGVQRTYNILNLLSADGDIVTDSPPQTVPIIVTNS